MKNFFLGAFLILSLLGCGGKEEQNERYSQQQIQSLGLDSTKILNIQKEKLKTIDVNHLLGNNKDFDFGSMVEEVHLTALETTSESLVDQINKVIFTESNIYVYDDYKGGGIVIFDSNGKFLKRISEGKGPGEINNLYDVEFDEETRELIAYQHPFLLFYSSEGEYLRQERLPLGFYNFNILPNGYAIKTLDGRGNFHLQPLDKFTFYVADKNFELQYAGLPNKNYNIEFHSREYLHKIKSDIFITKSFSDTIYEYKLGENTIMAKYLLDYKSKKLPENYLMDSFSAFDNAVRSNDYYFYLGKYLNTGDYSVFFLENFFNKTQTIIFMDNNNDKLYGGTTARYDVKEIPPIAFPKDVSDEYFVSWYLPFSKYNFEKSTLISISDKKKIKNLSEDDNPILVRYKLKKIRNE